MARGFERPPRWAVIILVVGVVALLALGTVAALRGDKSPPAATAEFTPTPEPPAAMFFGDSYFNGSQGVDDSQTMAYVAGATLGYQPLIRGNGGTGFISPRTTEPTAPNFADQISEGELEVAPQFAVSLVVLEGGLLDQRQPADEIDAAVSSVVDAIHTEYPQVPLILLGPPDNNETPSPAVQKVEDVQREVAKQKGLPFVAFDDLVSHDELVQLLAEGSDGIHPSIDGHRLLGERLAEELIERGVQPSALAAVWKGHAG